MSPSYYPHHLMASLSSSSSSSSSFSEERESFGFRCMASELFARAFSVVFTCIFAIVGSLVGAVTGALIGLATESGFLRGSGVGAISGAVFSIEVIDSSLDLWNSRDSGIWSLLYLQLDIISSLFNGRLVREKVGPAVQSAVQSQMNALGLPFMETLDLYDAGANAKGLSVDEVEKLPKSKVTARDELDASEEKTSCSVCLQELQLGEMVRRLPVCCHVFHLSCIDSWLIRHGSCPLCRRDV
ncbi:NEP1-interacting protein-like 1 isoform X1 [Zingiber officinale]|uniref:NEP1-interacting protein-like 1 isoform X1 n=1 Tax=Zingiber officinale TaxID=94328 RepID=UPI001C4C7ECC|nr:NEP1-interacting protein-like 1 isoform X1 [Zingiber officinale]